MSKSFPLLPLVLGFSFLALLAGLWAGLLRLGWLIPGGGSDLPFAHGPLMVSGFLGSLIAVERVVALRQRWMFIAPLLTGLGWISALALPGQAGGPLLITLGSFGTMVILGVMVSREPALHVYTIGLGTICWFTGNLSWLLGSPIFQIVFWWMAFLVLTITGERLELSRVLRLNRLKRVLFLLAGGFFFLGVVILPANAQVGTRLAGAGLIGLALWLAWFDIARRNLRHPAPLTRYIARCLFAGYFWLGLGGIFCIWFGAVVAGPRYDAVLHAIFVGFVLSMIFGHAPIILPAILNRTMRSIVPYHPAFYGSLVLLHVSLAIRIIGDLGGWLEVRQWGGLLNEVSLLLFLGLLVFAIRNQGGASPGRKEA